MSKTYTEATPANIEELIKLSNDKLNYKNRLKAIEGFGKWKCRQSIDKLWRLMISDKVYSVQRNSFLKLQLFGEKVKLPKKKKGHLVKDINKKLLKIYASFKSDEYSIIDFKIKFKKTYPEIYDIYTFEKKQNFDSWIETVIKHAPKKKLKNTYNITISFKYKSTASETIIFSKDIPYKNSSGNLDTLKISNKFIKIKADRTAIISPKIILENDINTIHIQIIKSLLFYYLHFGKFIEISSIHITREKSKILEEYLLPNKDTKIQQVLNKAFLLKSSYSFNSLQLESIFNTDDKSITIFNSTSYLLKALSSDESSEKFEKLWKAFNSIYRYIGKSGNDNTCHIELRKYLINNKSLFPLSVTEVNSLDKKALRSNLRLRDLILNDYETKNLTVSFLSFIYRYTDSRICELFQDTLVYREKYLKEINTINNVESKFNKLTNITQLYQLCKNNPSENCIYNKAVDYLKQNIENNVVADIEVVAFICIKYSYFIRNKIFHAEKHDLSFRFIENNQVDEINWINDILEVLIIELLKNSNSWD